MKPVSPIPTETTRCSEPPTALLKQCRKDESGVQRTARKKRVSRSFPRPVLRRASSHTDHISPDLDALGYDPFDDQPTLVNTGGWGSMQAAHAPPALLTRRKDDWLDELPEAARVVLLEASVAIPADALRLPHAVARARLTK